MLVTTWLLYLSYYGYYVMLVAVGVGLQVNYTFVLSRFE